MVGLKRILAAIIDFYIVCFFGSLMVYIITLGNMNTNFVTIFVYFFSVFFLWFIKDFIFKDSSIGKKIFKLKILSNEGSLSLISAVKRFLPLFFLPLEVILVLKKNTRIGDVWAKTIVISTSRKNK